MDAISVLADLGFSDYEARAYVALLRRNPANGYELAKLSDIPRGNVYAVLQRLEDRGAAVRVDTPDGTRYAPILPQEMLQRMEGRFQASVDTAAQLLDQVTSLDESMPVFNLGEYGVLLEHARSLIGGAQEHLLLAVWPEEARALGGDVSAAVERGVEIRTLCLAGCAQECGACRGSIHRYRLLPEQATRWLVVVPDQREVLAGQVGGASAGGHDGERAQGFRTRQRLLVDLTSSYIRHSIGLAAVLEDAGPKLNPLLSATTRDVLNMIAEKDGLGGWLAHLHQVQGSEDEEAMS